MPLREVMLFMEREHGFVATYAMRSDLEFAPVNLTQRQEKLLRKVPHEQMEIGQERKFAEMVSDLRNHR
jgi:hypothetical protein